MKKLCLLFGLVALSGCDGEGPARPDGATSMDEPPTYHADVRPLIERECLGCHVDGGIGPFPLDGYEAVTELGTSVVGAVEIGYMPPWLPDDGCREYEHARGLDDEERAVFTRWLEADMPEGDPADAPPPPPGPPTLDETDVARMLEPYTPDASRPDDYRCFLLDQTFAEDSFVTGSEVVPGARSIVHHVLVYALTSDQIAAVEAADAAEAGPGYTCFGGPIPSGGSERASLGMILLGAWVPGMVPRIAREGRATYVPAGARIVMQVHYNLLSSDPVPDETEYHLAVTTTPPEFHTTTFPTAILDLDIPAGQSNVRHRSVFRSYRAEPMRLTAVTPHMHLLGTQIGMRLLPAEGATAAPECLVQIPDWDFNWQQGYRFLPDDEVTLDPGEGLELTCIYDNSETNQPVINGERVTPRDVSWGEGTLDEMCLLYVQHEEPWTGPPSRGCEALDGCMAGCADSDTACLLRCEGLGSSCRVCALESTLGCARSTCMDAYVPAGACIQSCILSYAMIGGSFERCMQAECEAAWPGVLSCVSGVIEAGTCDAELASCGISF